MIYEDEILKVLPLKISSEIRGYFQSDKIQEIRIKVGKPIILNSFKGERILKYTVTAEDIKQILVKISNYSLYAYEEEIKQGYITIKGGHRIGIAGECVIVGGIIRTIKNISSLNIRICREVIGSSNEVMKYIAKNNRIYNTLIVAPPKCGKTTILRDIARNVSYGMNIINLSGKKVSIIDERSEIAACFNGVPQMDVGVRTDVLDNCLKREGMLMAIRSLSPEVLICDEIGTKGDIEALLMAFNSGVNVVVTLHGFSIDDIYKRKVFKELLDNSILDRIVILSNKNGVGTIENMYAVGLGGEVKCLK
ncbi:stage III sporulation protein AA [Clostridium gasigenes]|uniref:stage III sporulation protein AA n=1 Tax=Clostridium gasigenes TaxID=94869 RepID=UPI000B7F606F|nr:stage III sporulation protein AA [Clostridium gasigenes]MBB6625174.1 stage III sporulation protein AA [Clostridium gasigenes]MBU3087366.1 stage III sporulation protein AA [Clostridium gasigenes]MBU3106605.1 stage III sporulation protein AA [Clostridium gasigenes]MBU3131506.1 stage III sporulation protein AA [Clostridium gasigenes]NKF05329.1 stage III sporulation protein AA [Clostridium gasigenes]